VDPLRSIKQYISTGVLNVISVIDTVILNLVGIVGSRFEPEILLAVHRAIFLQSQRNALRESAHVECRLAAIAFV